MNTGWTSTRPYPAPMLGLAPCNPFKTLKACSDCMRHQPGVPIRAEQRITVVIDASLFLAAKGRRCQMYVSPSTRMISHV